MIVARQFIAWDLSKKRTRPVGGGMARVAMVLFNSATFRDLTYTDQTVPRARPVSWARSQAIYCLATIIQSLRDNKSSLPSFRF